MLYLRLLSITLSVCGMTTVSFARPIVYEQQTINYSYVDFPTWDYHWVEFMGFDPARGTLLEVVVGAYWDSAFYHIFENPTAESRTITQETELYFRALFGSTVIANDPGWVVPCSATVPAHSTAICTLGGGNAHYGMGVFRYSYYHPDGGWGDPVVEDYLAAGPLRFLVYTETFVYSPHPYPILSSNNFTLTVEYGYIPEPTTFGLALIGAAFLVALRARRRGSSQRRGQ